MKTSQQDKPYKFDAAKSLVGGSINQPFDGPLIYLSGQTEPTESELATELTRLENLYIAQEYARNRSGDYPEIGEQLNKIYDDGLTKWKAEMVDPVKAKWPKDNSGPIE